MHSQWALCVKRFLSCRCRFSTYLAIVALVYGAVSAHRAHGQTNEETGALTSQQWEEIDNSVERALLWLASQQQPDGSFPTLPQGQPAVTSLCLMAFVAHGHLPGGGVYGDQLQAAVDYVLHLQKPNGLISLTGPNKKIDPTRVDVKIGIPASYNHALSSLMLSEIYGMGIENGPGELQSAIEESLELTLKMQLWPKARKVDQGGWRYLTNYDQYNADLSVTGWYLMYLRSAKNAGFDVPKKHIDEAVRFVRKCYLPQQKVFTYFPESNYKSHRTPAMQGAGILALSHAGVNQSQEAQHASEWLLRHPYRQYGVLEGAPPGSRYHYGLFLCTLGMHQMGDNYWSGYFPAACSSLLSGQQQDGSWPVERQKNDHTFGNCYSTALSVLTLATPNELLPIFQR